jgi:hypothetical protein
MDADWSAQTAKPLIGPLQMARLYVLCIKFIWLLRSMDHIHKTQELGDRYLHFYLSMNGRPWQQEEAFAGGRWLAALLHRIVLQSVCSAVQHEGPADERAVPGGARRRAASRAAGGGGSSRSPAGPALHCTALCFAVLKGCRTSLAGYFLVPWPWAGKAPGAWEPTGRSCH